MRGEISWLLEEETPEIRYRALTELLGKSKEESEVREAYEQLLNSEQLNMVMKKFERNDKWEDVNALMALAEFGLTRTDVAIDEYVERTIARKYKGMKCSRILMLRNLAALGYYEHELVQKEIESAIHNIREDGSVRCLDQGKKRNDSRLPEMGCYRQTTTYLLLGAELKKKGVILPEFGEVVRFYREHNVMFHSGEEEKVIIKDMTGTFYPIDHVHIGLQMILYGLSVLGAGNAPECRKAWDLLDGYRDSEGRYVLSESFDEPYIEVGKAGHPNKWVTLYRLLSEKYRISENR